MLMGCTGIAWILGPIRMLLGLLGWIITYLDLGRYTFSKEPAKQSRVQHQSYLVIQPLTIECFQTSSRGLI